MTSTRKRFPRTEKIARSAIRDVYLDGRGRHERTCEIGPHAARDPSAGVAAHGIVVDGPVALTLGQALVMSGFSSAGIHADHGAVVNAAGVTVEDNEGDALYAACNATGDLTGARLSGNVQQRARAEWCGSGRKRGDADRRGSENIRLMTGAIGYGADTILQGTASNGLFAEGSTVRLANATVSGNGTHGAYCTVNTNSSSPISRTTSSPAPRNRPTTGM